MKSVLMPDEQSRRKQLHILPPPQELSIRKYLNQMGFAVEKKKYTNFYVTDLVTMAL
jgi:hypothetical protein